MHIASQLGKGTVVTLWLPRAGAADAINVLEQSVIRAPEVPRRKLRVLLVDDDSLVSMNTAEMLIDLGHSVLESPSAEDALRILASDRAFDVILTDYAMPGMNGLDLATKIKRMNPEVPVILATGYADLPPQTVIGFPRLAKPYTQEELTRILETEV